MPEVKIKTKPNQPPSNAPKTRQMPKLSASKRSSGLPHPTKIQHPTSNIGPLALYRPSILRSQPTNDDEIMTPSRQPLLISPVVCPLHPTNIQHLTSNIRRPRRLHYEVLSISLLVLNAFILTLVMGPTKMAP